MGGWRAEWRVWRSDPSDADLHEIRKRAKRARYAAELATDALHEDAGPLAERLADLQDVLGELQDGVVAEKRLTMLVRSGRLAGESAFAAGMVAASKVRFARPHEIAGRPRGRRPGASAFGSGFADPHPSPGLLAGTQH